MKAARQHEIIPLDIRKLRQGIGISQKTLGHGIAKCLQKPLGTIPQSRVNEWEKHIRNTPDHIYSACAAFLLDLWSRSRKKVSDENRARIDVKFAHLLSPALAEMMELQYYLEQCGTDDVAIKNVMNARLALEIYLESIFRIKFSRVFIDDTNSSPPKMEDSH